MMANAGTERWFFHLSRVVMDNNNGEQERMGQISKPKQAS